MGIIITLKKEEEAEEEEGQPPLRPLCHVMPYYGKRQWSAAVSRGRAGRKVSKDMPSDL